MMDRLQLVAWTTLIGGCHLIGGAGDLGFGETGDGGGGAGGAATNVSSVGTTGGVGGAPSSSSAVGGYAAGGEAAVARPSCEGLAPLCGASGTENCCDSFTVPGATFDHLGASLTVSSFRLDRYEVTVGRFRSFVQAVADGWWPAPGTGRHLHVSGVGLVDDLEMGWNPVWDALLPTDEAGWNAMLGCAEFGAGATAFVQWTESPGEREQRPITCMSWQAAYAFCIFDGGFLPTEAEWSLAATGGHPATHPYPWGTAAPDSSRAAFDCTACDRDSLAEVGHHPQGAAPFGHEDMAGNAWEWTLDRFTAPFAKPMCEDCAILAGTGTFTVRGGSFGSPAGELESASRTTFALARGSGIGFRCALPPVDL